MVSNHFKIAWRNLVRNKSFSLINIGGLSVGIAASLLLYMVVSYELSYNQFFPNKENIYQIVTKSVDEGGEDYTPGVPLPALEAFRLGVPEVKIAPLIGNGGCQISLPDENGTIHPDKKFMQDIYFTDAELFNVLQFKWLSGSPEILNEPNTIVLTKKEAEKHFSSWQNALNKTIHINNQVTANIGGVLEDIPLNSDFPLYYLISYATYKNNPKIFGYTDQWGSNSSDNHLYMSIPVGTSVADIAQKLNAVSTPRYNEIDQQEKREHLLLPLKEMHYEERYGTFGDYTISKNTLMMLSLIGVFILVMACINFINLSTAQAVNRSKEIGIRKVLGSHRFNIFWQLLSETSLIVLCSIIIALLLVKPVLPHIETLVGITEKLPLFTINNIVYLLLTGVIVSFIAGSYPAFVIAGFKPVSALKGKQKAAGKAGMRRGLVVLQFVISQVLIIGTLIAVLQMNMIKKSDLGFNKEAILVVYTKADSAVLSRQPAYKHELEKIPGVQSISFNSDVPSSQSNSSTNFAFDHKPDEKFSLYYKSADENYFSTFQIDFVAGRAYNANDSAKAVVVNETLVKMLGLNSAEEVIGKNIRMGGSRWLTITGVVKDFTTNTLKENIKPLLLGPVKRSYRNAALKISSNNLPATKNAVIAEWNKIFPEYVANDYWLDERITRFYQQEDQLTLLYKIFSGIAIFLSCLGLYGLISFTTVQKRKEVGIRKVLGASVGSILYLFSKEITLLIIVALAISIPVAWWISKEWLTIFATKITISWTIFLVAAIASIGIAWLTISIRSLKAATSNPVKSLRDE
ncbi:ABC transporter permease [Gynurincola endophyticus]|uniref:ABC transporter permease n=1 Tax=Gynurincola endophyticus TaxID=2479004 RepID=UPI000F8DE9B0|nr:ABC transporter permease [Gynurincola endophyticus]